MLATAHGVSAGWAVPEGVPHGGRTVDTQHAERLVSRDETKKVRRVCCDMAGRTFFGPSTPDGPCAISAQPAESTGPRLGAGFQDAAREARGRSSPVRR